MEITIKCNAKEIAALVLELQERQGDNTKCEMGEEKSNIPAFIPHDSNGINNEGVSQEYCP